MTAFQNPNVRFVNINTAEFDAYKVGAIPVVGDARTVLEQLNAALARAVAAAALLEAAASEHEYKRGESASALLRRALAALRLRHSVAGELGVRTEHQVDAKAQLVLRSGKHKVAPAPTCALAQLGSARGLGTRSRASAAIAQLHQDGLTILLVEQNAKAALAIADRGFVLEAGRITLEGSAKELGSNAQLVASYLGG